MPPTRTARTKRPPKPIHPVSGRSRSVPARLVGLWLATLLACGDAGDLGSTGEGESEDPRIDRIEALFPPVEVSPPEPEIIAPTLRDMIVEEGVVMIPNGFSDNDPQLHVTTLRPAGGFPAALRELGRIVVDVATDGRWIAQVYATELLNPGRDLTQIFDLRDLGDPGVDNTQWGPSANGGFASLAIDLADGWLVWVGSDGVEDLMQLADLEDDLGANPRSIATPDGYASAPEITRSMLIWQEGPLIKMIPAPFDELEPIEVGAAPVDGLAASRIGLQADGPYAI